MFKNGAYISVRNLECFRLFVRQSWSVVSVGDALKINWGSRGEVLMKCEVIEMKLIAHNHSKKNKQTFVLYNIFNPRKQ